MATVVGPFCFTEGGGHYQDLARGVIVLQIYNVKSNLKKWLLLMFVNSKILNLEIFILKLH